MEKPRLSGPWRLEVLPYESEEDFRFGSLMMTGNGYLGFRGGFPWFRKEEYAACVVTDTYDCADGKWKELCTVPNALYLSARVNGTPVRIEDSSAPEAGHSLDFRYGETSGTASSGNSDLLLSFQRFASYPNLHRVCQRINLSSLKGTYVELTAGIDSDVWSLNGDHFRTMKLDGNHTQLTASMSTVENGTAIVVGCGLKMPGSASQPEMRKEKNGIYQHFTLSIPAGETISIEQIMVVYSANDCADPAQAVHRELKEASDTGYQRELEEHRKYWDRLWDRYDIEIDGDEEVERLLRYNTYHNVIATPAHSNRLPIGARGLSCQAYQGAAFWDQEIFNLPMYIYTNPEVAANILGYRHATLQGALNKAARLGWEGAYYPWISGDSGEELCPDYFFIDVLSGRKIRNHFNDWQIHISPDISYALWEYYRSGLDEEFLRTKGAEVMFRVAQFLYSRIHYAPARDRYEIIRVLGPDEYHENVDNNAFTNYQSQFAMQVAVRVYRKLKKDHPAELTDLCKRIGLEESRVDEWQSMADKIYLPQADSETLLIEQFDGYFKHEDILPGPLAGRLQKESEYWGWPNGIAFETQVLKQADVVQLFALHPFPDDVIAANYDYYEPRSQHRSSLSPGVHALVAAKSGNLEQADSYLRKSLRIDIANTHPPSSGGTFIGGIHTAACGIAWQIIVKGYLGLEVDMNEVRFQPRLPEGWKSIALKLIIRGLKIRLELRPERLLLAAEPDSAGTVTINAAGKQAELTAGGRAEFTLTN